MTPQLSIIIPVYNTAEFLPECLDSCLAQTFTDWECFLVDDGSTDCSLAICEEYAGRDARFRLIQNHHGGVAVARNNAMRIARGKWFGFVDSDDRIRPDMFDRMIQAQQNSHADVVLCSMLAFESPDRPVFYPDFLINAPKERLFGMAEANLFSLCDAGPCSKLFCREFLEKHGLQFPQKLRYEDIFFWNRLVRYYPSMYYLPEKFYEYRQNRKGSTTSSHTIHCLALSFFATMRTIEILSRPDMMQAFGKRFSLRAFKAAAQVSYAERQQFVRRCRAIFRHVYRKHPEARCVRLSGWAKCPEWLLHGLILLCFPLRLHSLTQFLKKCDSFFHTKTECVL